jgi:hypothetical protein
MLLLLSRSRSTRLGINCHSAGDGGVVGGDDGGGLGALLLGTLLGVDLVLELVDVLGGLGLVVVHGNRNGESGHGQEGEVLDLHSSRLAVGWLILIEGCHTGIYTAERS